MKKVKLGRREFELMQFTTERVNLLISQFKTLGKECLILGEDGKCEVGKVILFVLIACIGNEHNALQVGEMLIETEGEYIKMEQLTEAFSIIRKAMEEWE